jgi:hypothetical protein
MPHTHQPDPTAYIAVTRTCPAGGGRMCLIIARPSNQFVNLDECLYRCDSGEQAEYVMMRPE